MEILVTGGAGFIGSHLTDKLIEMNNRVTVIDDLSSGRMENLNPKAGFVKKNLLVRGIENELKNKDAVFHMAADPDVRLSASSPNRSFDNNLVLTFRLLEACRKSDVKRFVMASSSTVYGEVNVFPTPEKYSCNPISNYGASKLACEAYCSSYAYSYGIKTTVLRYANIFGERSTHGVIHDFFKKLKENPNELEILGDGKQTKSYLLVQECVDGIIYGITNSQDKVNIFNLGSEDQIDVTRIAEIVVEEMGLKTEEVKFNYTGGKRGWRGDVPQMRLAVDKIQDLGWKAENNSENAIRASIKALLAK